MRSKRARRSTTTVDKHFWKNLEQFDEKPRKRKKTQVPKPSGHELALLDPSQAYKIQEFSTINFRHIAEYVNHRYIVSGKSEQFRFNETSDFFLYGFPLQDDRRLALPNVLQVESIINKARLQSALSPRPYFLYKQDDNIPITEFYVSNAKHQDDIRMWFKKIEMVEREVEEDKKRIENYDPAALYRVICPGELQPGVRKEQLLEQSAALKGAFKTICDGLPKNHLNKRVCKILGSIKDENFEIQLDKLGDEKLIVLLVNKLEVLQRKESNPRVRCSTYRVRKFF